MLLLELKKSSCKYKIVALLYLSLFSLNVSKSWAHATILSEYTLQYEDEHWILSFSQKTSHLRDAIYFSKEHLKGINLNSKEFLAATADHISSSLFLTYEDESLRIQPRKMKYGGLRFESEFIVYGLPENPDFLTIKAEGFDAHEHSIILFKVSKGMEGYLNYFNQKQQLASFNFSSNRYDFGKIETDGELEVRFGHVFVLVLIVGFAILLTSNKMLVKMMD